MTKEQIELLELDYTFEIELDMEDVNYIAIDKKGKVYKLNHDHEKNGNLYLLFPPSF